MTRQIRPGQLQENVLYNISASFAISASHEITHEASSSYAETASFAVTASHLLNNPPAFPFTGSAEISGSLVVNSNSTSETFRITQTGTGDAIRIEDSSNPDSTPTVITKDGDMFIGSSSAVTTVGGLSPKLYIKNGSSGYSGNLAIDTAMLFEGSGATYFGTLSPDNVVSGLYMGSPSDVFGSVIRWGYDAGNLELIAASVGHGITFQVGNKSQPSVSIIPNISSTSDYNATVQVTGSVTVLGSVTASGNISSSGNITAVTASLQRIQFPDNSNIVSSPSGHKLEFGESELKLTSGDDVFLQLDDVITFANAPVIIPGNITAGGTISNISTTHITASGNISSSGTIVASNLSGTNTGDQDLSSFITNSQTASMSVESASFATTASHLLNNPPPFPFTGDAVITGSLVVSGSGINVTSGSITGDGSGLTNISSTSLNSISLGLSTIVGDGASSAASYGNVFGKSATSTGGQNVAIGGFATVRTFGISIGHSTNGGARTVAIGYDAGNGNGEYNVLVGPNAGTNSSGDYNIALGYLAGYDQTTGTGNITIGSGSRGLAGESNQLRIGHGIHGATISASLETGDIITPASITNQGTTRTLFTTASIVYSGSNILNVTQSFGSTEQITNILYSGSFEDGNPLSIAVSGSDGINKLYTLTYSASLVTQIIQS